MKRITHIKKEVQKACEGEALRTMDFKLKLELQYNKFKDAYELLKISADIKVPYFKDKGVRDTIRNHKCLTRGSAMKILLEKMKYMKKLEAEL